MKSYLAMLILCLFGITQLLAQAQNVDIVVNSSNTGDLSAKSLLTRYFDEHKSECVNYNFVDNREAVTADYYMEIWERTPHTSDFLFNELRTEKVDNGKGGTKEKKVRYAGVRVSTLNDYIGRMLRTKNDVVVETFEVKGSAYYNIDDKYILKEMRGKNKGELAELEEAMLIKHEAEIADRRRSTEILMVNRWGKLVSYLNNKFFLSPIQLTKAIEKSKDKMKKMAYVKCAEQSFDGDGNFMTTVYSKNELNGVSYYIDEGGSYIDPKNDKQINIRGGKKEIFKAHAAGKDLLVGRKMFFQKESEYKNEKPQYITFLEHKKEIVSTLDDYEKMEILLALQASYLDMRNLEVLAYYDVKEQANDVTNMVLPKFIHYGIGNLEKHNHIIKDKKFLRMQVTANFDDKELDKSYNIYVTKNKLGNYLEMDVDLEDFDKYLIQSEVVCVGTIEEKKDKTKKILVQSMNTPIEDVNCNVYTTPNATKKTKKLAEIDIKEITGKYTAIAEVKKGDKEIYKALKAGTKLYFIPKKKGRFSFSGDNWERSVRYFR